MSEEFVRKDVHNAELRRIDEKIDATVSRIEAKLEASNMRNDAAINRMEQRFEAAVERMYTKLDAHMARVDGVISRMEGRLDAMDAKISNVSRNVALILTIFGLIISGISIYFSMPH